MSETQGTGIPSHSASPLEEQFAAFWGEERGDILQRLGLWIDKLRGENMTVVIIMECNHGSYLQWIRGHITGKLQLNKVNMVIKTCV